mgnify:CR=1 FL=1
MAYSIDPIQDNCYPGTTVLVNKLHIHDEAALQEAEALATYVNVSKLEHSREPAQGIPCAGSFVEGRSRVMRMIRDSGRTNIVHTIAKKIKYLHKFRFIGVLYSTYPQKCWMPVSSSSTCCSSVHSPQAAETFITELFSYSSVAVKG